MVTTSTLRRFVGAHPLATFLTVAFATSWLLWLPLALDPASADPAGGNLWWLHYLAGIGPAVGAVVTAWLIAGRRGAVDLGRRVGGRGAGARWILTGALLPILLLLLVVAVTGVATGSWIAWGELGRTAKLPGTGLLGILIVDVVFFGFGEETGWRGFAWPRLRARRGFLTSAALVTVPWTLWHLPTFAYNENMRALGVGGTVGWVLSLFTGSIVLGWLTDHAHGSVLPAALFHGILDVVFMSAAVAGVYDGPLGMAIMVFALVLVVARPLARRAGVTAARAPGAARPGRSR